MCVCVCKLSPLGNYCLIVIRLSHKRVDIVAVFSSFLEEGGNRQKNMTNETLFHASLPPASQGCNLQD